jgi:hypothetical protein
METIIRKYHGESWTPAAVIKSNGVAKDCTGLDAILVIKRDNLNDASLILSSSITWTNQASGLGTFSITTTQALTLEKISYYFEAILYGGTYRRTIKKGRLDIQNSLGTS